MKVLSKKDMQEMLKNKKITPEDFRNAMSSDNDVEEKQY